MRNLAFRASVSMILFALLAVNLSATTPAPITPPVQSACSAALSAADMAAVSGGVDVVAVIDGSCVGAGLGALFTKLNPFVGAFCAGWATGRFIDHYVLGN